MLTDKQHDEISDALDDEQSDDRPLLARLIAWLTP